jgi:hypothetical protein
MHRTTPSPKVAPHCSIRRQVTRECDGQ